MTFFFSLSSGRGHVDQVLQHAGGAAHGARPANLERARQPRAQDPVLRCKRQHARHHRRCLKNKNKKIRSCVSNMLVITVANNSQKFLVPKNIKLKT